MSPDPASTHIALIDDDAGQLDLLQMMMQKARPSWRLTTILADDAFVAQPALPSVDAVLTDYILGEQTAAALFAQPAVPVLVISGADDPDTQRACQQAGLHGPLAKPFSLNELQTLCERTEQLLLASHARE